MKMSKIGLLAAALLLSSGGIAFADPPSTWIELDENQNVRVVGARVSGILQGTDGAQLDDLLCEYDEVWGSFCWITVDNNLFGCGASDTILPALTPGTQVELRMSGGNCTLVYQQSPQYMAEARVTSPGGGSGGSDFVCSGACESAISLSSATTSSHLGGAAWYVIDSGPIAGWQLSDGAGRTVTVNGVQVSPGQVPLTANAEGKYYFHFSAGDYTWATWSWW